MLITCAADDAYLGYVFPFKSSQLEERLKASKLRPQDSAFYLVFGFPPRSKVEWPVLASYDAYRDEDWPIPCFYQTDPLLGITWKVHFTRNELRLSAKTERITLEEATQLEEVGILAAGGVEARVERLLGGQK